jgi:hypothetical protein
VEEKVEAGPAKQGFLLGGKGRVRQISGAVGCAEGSVVGFLYACVSKPRFISVSSGLFFLGGGEAFYSFVSKEREGRSLYYTSLLEKFMSEDYAVMQSCANVDEPYFSLYSIFY